MYAIIQSWMLQPSVTTPGLVEDDLARRGAGVELDLEGFRRREGVDVVQDRVVVGEGDLGPYLQDRQEGDELALALFDRDRAARAGIHRTRRRHGVDRGVRDRRAGGIAHLYLERGGLRMARAQRDCEERESGHRWVPAGDCADGSIVGFTDCNAG
jgi:hypothetical protein